MRNLGSTKIRLLLASAAVAIAGVTFGAIRLVSPAHAATIDAGQLDQIATSFAASFGDLSPSSITYVATTRQAANQIDSGAVVDSNQPAYLIVERGNFIDHADAPPNAAAAPPSGSVLTIIVDQQTGQVTDYGVSNNVPAIANLGPVSSLPN